MGRYLMTHSLLASWLYTMKENPYEDMTTERDPMGEFMQTLRREPTPTTEAMQNGIKFEDMVTDIINGRADPNDPWHAAAEKVARRCAGGVLQYKAKKIVEVGGMRKVEWSKVVCLLAMLAGLLIVQECLFLMYLCIKSGYTAAAAWLTAATGVGEAIIIAGANGYLSLAKSDHKRGGITFEAAKANNFRTDTEDDGSIDSPAI